ncbi:hypothetical protein [Actinoplanes sp. URMC 104]|uniref:hypothetical protein n=1 Tax=Actinoplanes sp. URMC 104 TaxID=3423409 RepID=UPI003F1BD9B5
MAARRAWAGAIRSPADVRRILADVNAEGLEKANTTALAHAVQPAEEVELAPDASRLLPAPPDLASLLPWPGLRRGATIAVTGTTSTLMRTLAAGMKDGAWAAVVGMPAFNALAAYELGVPVDRLALVADPGPDWFTAVAALIDGVGLVVVAMPEAAEKTVRLLQARARQRGSVLILTHPWPGSDVVITATRRRWAGLGAGRGRLKQLTVQLTAGGRGKAARPRTATVTFGELAPLRIPPPPPGLYPNRPGGLKSPLWQHITPNDPPTDAWTGLETALPRHRKRRFGPGTTLSAASKQLPKRAVSDTGASPATGEQPEHSAVPSNP